MGKRFAIVIGVAAAGVMALGAQTATSTVEPVDSTPPDLQLSGKKKQKLGKAIPPPGPGAGKPVKVKARCGEVCTASADGKLTKVKKEKPASDELGPGETTTLELKLTKNTRKQALKTLDKGKKVQAKVTVEATDAARNVATAKRTIRLVKLSFRFSDSP